jgi:hypothetical protein
VPAPRNRRHGGTTLAPCRQSTTASAVRTATARKEANERGGKVEQFFELLDCKAIASATQNWETFKPYFGIGPKQGKEASLSWFDRLSELRNRISHPERGPVSDDELDFIAGLITHFDSVEGNLP